MGMGEEVLQELKRKLEKSLEVVRDDLATIRAGRAKPALIEGVKVEAYGGVMELRELATITAPSADLLVVAPWDKSLVGVINKGIQAANLGLNPIVEGDQLKVPVPTLTEERRKELVKLVAQKVESGRVIIRQIRNEIKADIEELEGESGVSEDDVQRWLEEMQKMVDEYIGKVEELGKEKEKELMTI